MTSATIPSSVTPLRWATLGRVAAAVYAVAWTAGLAIAPASPKMDATATDLHEHFVSNGAAASAQSWLVHGLAGVALLVCLLAVARSLPAGPGRMVRIAGSAAVAVSFTQVVFLQVLVARLDGPASDTATWFAAINRADSLKLVLLGVAVAAVTSAGRRHQSFPRWIVGLGVVLAPLLPISGAAFVLESSTLYALLYLSLPLLITWVVAATAVTTRR